MPRVILSCFVGMALAVVGVVMQAVVKNPLADPYILGISSGASLGATLAILFGVGSVMGGNFVGIMAFIGAFLVSIGVLTISNIGGKSNSIRLLLAGMALSAVCSSFSSFTVFVANDREGIKSITYWLMGSLAGAKWSQLYFIMPFILVGTIFFLTQYRTLNLMLLGDDVSITLGKDLHNYRKLYLVITSLMMGLVVYCSGMIGFVGLIIPHISRMLFGTDHKRLIVISALFGSLFMILADILSRTLLPHAELPIGILISAIGAPCFIWLLCRKSYGFGGNKS
jgi:iron complex transport system permease protein